MDMSGLILDPPVVERNSARFLIRCAYDGNRALTVTIDAPVNVLDRLSPTVAPFVPIAMLVAGSEGCDLIVRGALEPLHWTKLTCEFWPLMRRLFGFPDVNLQSDNTGNPHGLIRRLAGAIKAPLDGVALIFSGGVDSFL
jgi:hypothetical protein